VRDVADAHIAGYENKDAHGRHILSSEISKSYLDFGMFFKPEFCVGDASNEYGP
jgi:hypothetical protein